MPSSLKLASRLGRSGHRCRERKHESEHQQPDPQPPLTHRPRPQALFSLEAIVRRLSQCDRGDGPLASGTGAAGGSVYYERLRCRNFASDIYSEPVP